MQIQTFDCQGLKLITLRSFSDGRGFFCERFRESKFAEMGLPASFVQDNFSRSGPGVLRGLHYQWDPPQGKLVTCLAGRILDVAVDLRQTSPTFGQTTQVELSGDVPVWFWIPAGFAHGFCVLGDQDADVFYKCDREYNGAGEGGIHYNDPDLGLRWPIKSPIVSERDAAMPSFASYQKFSRFR